MSLKRNIRFYQDNLIPVNKLSTELLPEINNIIYEAQGDNETLWIEESTKQLAEWNNIFKSTYIRWALAINGLHLAQEKYSKPEFYENKQFTISGIRKNGENHIVRPIMYWDGQTAAKSHFETVNMIASYGLIDLYGLFEEAILSLFRIYRYHHPEQVLIGPENKEMRKLLKNKDNEPDAWEEAWNERLDNWQRKKVYQGIDKILIGYYKSSGLEKPSDFKDTEVEDWAYTLKGISVLRNCLIHGTYNVPKELAEFSGKEKSFEFKFDEGEPIELDTKHLMSVELFSKQLLGAINVSLMEKIAK